MNQALIEKRKTYQVELADALKRIRVQLAENPAVHKVVLFGSYAAGREDLFTDIDLLVVMDSERDYVTRTAELYAALQGGVDLDLLVYTPAEFEQMRQKPFLQNALAQGKVLYEKE